MKGQKIIPIKLNNNENWFLKFGQNEIKIQLIIFVLISVMMKYHSDIFRLD